MILTKTKPTGGATLPLLKQIMTEKKTIRLEKDVQADKTYYKVYVDDTIAEVSMTLEEAETAYEQIKARLQSGELLGKTVLKAETIDVPSV